MNWRDNNEKIKEALTLTLYVFKFMLAQYYSERFLETVLIEYLSTIGIVNLIVKARHSYYDVLHIGVEYFKLTALAAHVLGVNDEYKNNIVLEDVGMIIHTNFEIMVTLYCKI